jgi:prolyl oligopeptidase
LHQLPLEIGSVTETSGRREDSQVYFNFTSFLTPGIIYWYDLSSSQPELKVLRETAVANFDRTSFEIKQVQNSTCHDTLSFYKKKFCAV